MNDRNFEVIMSCYDKTITVNRDHPDISINEAIEDIVTCLLGLTFSRDQIIRGFSEYVEAENEIS
jgi:hypothetical protein